MPSNAEAALQGALRMHRNHLRHWANLIQDLVVLSFLHPGLMQTQVQSAAPKRQMSPSQVGRS